jgi:hypothetical protein
MLKPWREEEGVALGDVRRDRLRVQLALLVVGHSTMNHSRTPRPPRRRHDAEALGLGLGAALAAFVQADAHVDRPSHEG